MGEAGEPVRAVEVSPGRLVMVKVTGLLGKSTAVAVTV
jgi:hypothetical protein